MISVTIVFQGWTFFHAQYDWTTGVPNDGNEWRKFRVVPRSHPLQPLFCTLFNWVGNRRALRRLPGEGGDHFHCTVEPSAGHVRCRSQQIPQAPARCPSLSSEYFPGEKRHININFLLWLTSRWPSDKRLVVPGLTGPKSLCVRLETQEI